MMRKAMVGVVIWVGCGCGNPYGPRSASEFELDELAMHIRARSNGGLAQAFVALRFEANGARDVLLSDDEILLFSSLPDGREVRLVLFENDLGWFNCTDFCFTGPWYAAEASTEATAFELILQRGAERVVRSIELPPPFSLSGPATTVSRSDPIPIAWNISEPDHRHVMRLVIHGPCMSSPLHRELTGDPGGYEIQPADIPPASGSCDLDVEVTRGTPVGVGSHRGSSLATAQVRAISIATEP